MTDATTLILTAADDTTADLVADALAARKPLSSGILRGPHGLRAIYATPY